MATQDQVNAVGQLFSDLGIDVTNITAIEDVVAALEAIFLPAPATTSSSAD